MPQKERLRVWRGELKKTAGGLTKADLIKNKRGRIVSKKKSLTSKVNNNLKGWLREKGDSFGGKLKDAGKPLPAKKGQGKKKKAAAPKAAAPKPKPKPQVKKPAPKPNKQTPKKQAPKQKPKKQKKSPKKAGEAPDLSKVDIGNILVKKKEKHPDWPMWARKAAKHMDVEAAIEEELEMFDGGKPDWGEVKDTIKELYGWLKL